jgi:hypothetical protein
MTSSCMRPMSCSSFEIFFLSTLNADLASPRERRAFPASLPLPALALDGRPMRPCSHGLSRNTVLGSSLSALALLGRYIFVWLLHGLGRHSPLLARRFNHACDVGNGERLIFILRESPTRPPYGMFSRFRTSRIRSSRSSSAFC